VGLPDETLEETEPAQGHHGVETRFACPSPNIKRPRTCLAESGKKAARTNPRGGAFGGSPSSVERDGGRDEEHSIPSPAGVQEEATYYDKELPLGWIRVKLEPDW
jgi:hypothetical protein